VTLWFTVASALGMLGVVLYLEWLQYLLGSAFRVDLHLVPILLLANVLLGVYYNLSVWYRIKDRTATGAAVALAAAGITVVLNVLLLPRIGYAASAWAALAAYAFLCALTWWLGRSVYPVPYPLGRMAAYLALAYGLGAAATALDPLLPSAWQRFGVHTVLFLVFPGVVWLLEKETLARR
jgi:O-antigen/teichoic acid export membrane protein